MAEMNEDFNQDNVIRNIAEICGCELENLPHGDTINLLFKRLDVQEIKNLITNLVKRMIENRSLERYRVFDNSYQLIIDGTQLYCFHQEHVKNSLTRTHSDGTTSYHTQVLAAYLMIGNNLIVPVDFEMMENEETNTKKQDCEINAAKRLLRRLKKTYPRLRIVLSADALYAKSTIINLCKRNRWHYIIRFKRGCIENIFEEYEEHKANGYAQSCSEEIVKNKKTVIKRKYTYVNELEYDGKKVNLAEMEEIRGDKRIDFIFMTDIKINGQNIKEIIQVGRKRWKIENKGFNDEKHHGFAMEHAYSYHENAVKCHYALMLIAHLIMQLLEHYMKTQDNAKKIMEIGKEIKEALRYAHLNAQDYVEILKPFQIRQEIPY